MLPGMAGPKSTAEAELARAMAPAPPMSVAASAPATIFLIRMAKVSFRDREELEWSFRWSCRARAAGAHPGTPAAPGRSGEREVRHRGGAGDAAHATVELT